MRFYEFEAKALLGKAGVPVAKGGTATTADEAARIAASVGGEVVLKSQVLSGGRMKAGGVKFASTAGRGARGTPSTSSSSRSAARCRAACSSTRSSR